MIELYYNNGDIFVFDVNDWALLRKTYRILGTFTGNLLAVQTLPLRLLPEEVLLLIDRQVVKVIDRSFDITSEDQDRHKDFEKTLLEQEKVKYKEVRKRQLECMIDDIVAAKRRHGDERPADEIFKDELEKSVQVTEENMIWPIHLTSCASVQSVDVQRDVILKNTSELRYQVYKDLWEKGYYLTTGHKFGGDFLAYLGDPIAYHAIFIIHCVSDPSKPIFAKEVVAFGRLASSVKKHAVLASHKDNKISYITINWIDA